MSRLTLAEEGLEALFGAHDQNLKRIEREFDVRLAARGNELSIDGEAAAVARVSRMMQELSTLSARGFRLRVEDMRTAIRVARQAPDMSLIDFFQPTDHILNAARRMISPRSVNQYLYMQAMLKHDMVVSAGPAGTGKTFLAVAMAAAALKEKQVQRIVLARPAVEAGDAAAARLAKKPLQDSVNLPDPDFMTELGRSIERHRDDANT